MINHRLCGMRCYLSGPMDHAVDNGAGWREKISPFLRTLGIIVLNPCKKYEFYKNENGNENGNENKRELLEKLRKEKNFEQINKEVKEIRRIDLRLVSISDFLVVCLDNDILSCGTWEEIGKANDQEKPILVMCKQDKNSIPGWVFGMLPHEHLFGNWIDLKDYLIRIHSAEQIDDMKRWIFFDYSKLVPKISIEESEHKGDL
jgi:nucleoside 2-deoxyribosyltransferase